MTIQQIKLSKAIKLWMLSLPPKTFIDDKGFERTRYITYKEASEFLDVPWVTLWRWVKHGKVAKFYIKKLLKEGVIKQEDLDVREE